MRKGLAYQTPPLYGQRNIVVLPAGAGSPARYLATVGTTTALAYTADKAQWETGTGTKITVPLDEYGELDSALVTFGTMEPKRLHFAQIAGKYLSDGHRMGLRLTDENGDSIADAEVFRTDDAAVAGLTMDGLDAVIEKATVTVTMKGTTTESPIVRRWRLRAMPIIPPVEEWVIPLILRSTTVAGSGAGGRRTLSVADALDELRGLWRTKEACDLTIGTESYRARIEDFELIRATWEHGNVIGGQVVVRLVSI
jgi:hypothetical protein